MVVERLRESRCGLEVSGSFDYAARKRAASLRVTGLGRTRQNTGVSPLPVRVADTSVEMTVVGGQLFGGWLSIRGAYLKRVPSAANAACFRHSRRTG